MSKVIVKDRGWDRIKKDLSKYAKGLVASVGVQGTEASEDREGMTNAELAAIHEFGTEDETIPERSHFRKVFDDKRVEYQSELDKAARDFFDSTSKFKGALYMLGEEYAGDVKDAIRSGLEPDLSELNPRYPGTPLWHKGYYINSITSVVLDGNQIPQGERKE